MNRENRDRRAIVAFRQAITLATSPAATAPTNGDATKPIAPTDAPRLCESASHAMTETSGGSRIGINVAGHDHNGTFEHSGLIGNRWSAHSGHWYFSPLAEASEVTSYPQLGHLRVTTRVT